MITPRFRAHYDPYYEGDIDDPSALEKQTHLKSFRVHNIKVGRKNRRQAQRFHPTTVCQDITRVDSRTDGLFIGIGH